MSLLDVLRRAACLAFFAVALVPFAQAGDFRVQIDPSSETVTIDGWARRVADTGTIFYNCVADSCGRGSIVSMRKQTTAPRDVESIRRSEQGVSDAMIQRAQGRIGRVDLGEPTLVSDGQFRIGEITRTIVPASGNSIQGLSLYWKTGFVAAPNLIYSVGSSADSRDLANENFDAFKLALMMLGARRN